VSIANLSFLPPGVVVYYTLDGADPRSPTAQPYSGPITLNGSATVRARAFDPGTQTWSALTEATFLVGTPPALRVTEIMYNPADPAAGTLVKDDFEFIELANAGATAIDPAGIRFTNGITFAFADNAQDIAPGQRIVLVRNLAAFRSRYGDAIPVAGTYTGELSDSGERLTLATRFGQVIQSFRYDAGWFDQTDGDGFALVAVDPSASAAVLSSKEGWRSGQPMSGAPATDDPGLNNNSVVINEVMANGAGTSGGNWIELKNQTNQAIYLTGWYLSDDAANRTKWQIPGDTVIGPGAFLVLGEAGGFGSAFTLSALGGDVYLTSSSGSGVGGYRDHVDYGASDPNVSFGRHIKSTGGSDFVAMTLATRGAANAAPVVGPVVINEVMYNPFGLSREFIELRNVTDAEVSLAGWRFTDGINFTFPAGAAIPANGHALVVTIDPATYRSTYNVPADVAIFGPYTGLMNNAGEGVTLSRPGTPVGDVTPFIAVDRVRYDNDLPWPAAPNGAGPSLGRINPGRYGNDAANWRADSADGTGGQANALAPVVMVSTFGYGGPPAIRLKVNKDVATTIAKGDLVVVNLGSGGSVDPSTIGFSYDPATQTATWTLPTTLADGNYRATLSSGGVQDSQGRSLDGNSDGTGGDDFAYNFHHLIGDANGDRRVDYQDFSVLFANFEQAGKSFGEGDFNFDGAVDFLDFQILERAFGKVLPAAVAQIPAPPAVPVTTVPVTTSPVTRPKPQPRPAPIRQPAAIQQAAKRPVAKGPTVAAPAKPAKAPFARRVIKDELLG
jgi:hypothetical protein